VEARVGIEPTHKGFADPVFQKDKPCRLNTKAAAHWHFVRFLSTARWSCVAHSGGVLECLARVEASWTRWKRRPSRKGVWGR